MIQMYQPFSFDKTIPYVSTNVGQLLLFEMGSLLGLGVNNLLAKYRVSWNMVNIPPTKYWIFRFKQPTKMTRVSSSLSILKS
jgi:hypothetical protein